MQFIDVKEFGNTRLGAGVMIHSYGIPNADFGGINLGLIPEIGNTTNGANGAQIPMVQNIDAADVAVGKAALQHFHDRASGFSDYGYNNIIELAAHYTKNPDILFEGIGFAINSIGSYLNEDKIRNAMYAIADQGKGKVPTNMSTFFSKLGEIASNPSVLESISYTYTKSLEDIQPGLAELGKSTMSSLKSANFLWQYWPYLAIGFGAMFVYMYAKGLGTSHGEISGRAVGKAGARVKEGIKDLKASTRKAMAR